MSKSRLLLDLEQYEQFAGMTFQEAFGNRDTSAAIVEEGRKWRRNRKIAITKNNGLCVYCGDKATCIDHVVPLSQHGTHDLSNLVPCCKRCNSRKKARTPEQAGMIISKRNES